MTQLEPGSEVPLVLFQKPKLPLPPASLIYRVAPLSLRRANAPVVLGVAIQRALLSLAGVTPAFIVGTVVDSA